MMFLEQDGIRVVPSRTFTIGTALTDGGGGLTKDGSGTLILSGANTYGGATTLNQGTLTFGVGTLANTTGALSVNNTNTASAGTATILNLSTAANTTTGTYSGTTTVNAGTLSLGHATDTLSDSSAVTVDGDTAVLAIAGNSDTVGAVSLKNGGSITGTGGTLTGASYALESGSVSANLGGSGIALTKSTADTVTLSGKNTYSGLTTITAGKLLFSRTDTTSDYAGTGGYSISSGATLEVNASAGARFNISNNQITGAGSFIKSGSGRTFFTAGTITQTFNMSAGGYIDIQAGILDSSAQATNLAALNIATGAQLVIANTDAITTLQFDALTGGGTMGMVGAGSRTVVLGANGGSGTFSGVINDTGTISLTKSGAGTKILSGANTYTGQTTISAGTLQIGAGSTTGKLSAGSAIVNNSNLTINRSDALTQGTDFSSAAITGTGSLTVAGTGITTLNAANSYSGVTTLSDDSDITLGANIWRFNYNDTSAGSNFISDTTGATNFVTMTIVPEPNSAILVGSLGIIVLLRRRR